MRFAGAHLRWRRRGGPKDRPAGQAVEVNLDRNYGLDRGDQETLPNDLWQGREDGRSEPTCANAAITGSMTGLGSLVAIVVLVYLFQCVCWAPSRAAVFEAEFPKRHIEKDRPEQQL